MDQFIRNEDGSIQVPVGVVDVAAIFNLGDTHSAVSKLVDLIGEEQAILLGEYAASLAQLTHPQLLSRLCEGWSNGLQIAPVIELLERLAPNTTLRAVLAQRLCGRYEEGAVRFSTVLHVESRLPFYRGVCGLNYQALRQADTVAG